MNAFRTDSTAHLADDELLRLLDGEDDAARPAWQAHVATCAQCAAALETMRGDAASLRHWLDSAAFESAAARDDVQGLLHAGTDPIEDADVIELRAAARRPAATPVVPRARTRPSLAPWLRAAAVLALLATPVAAIPALRHWLVDAVTGPTADPVASAPPAENAPAETDVIRFVPAAGAFEVEVAVAQRAGELSINRTAGAEARLQAGDEAGALAVVSAAVLRIRNEADHTTAYTLQLPATVSSVTVRVGGRATVIERSRIDAGAIVPLY